MRALRTDPLASWETRLRLRGQLALHQLLERAGGVYTALFDRCRDRLEEEDLGALAQWRCSATGQDILDILDAQGWGLV